MTEYASDDRRKRPDRRQRNLPIWHPRRLHGRRREDRRRAENSGQLHLVDRVSGRMFLMASFLLVLTLVDGMFTIALIDLGCEEANPLMRYLLDRSQTAFFIGKYALTAVFLPIALVLNRHRLFGTRLRVGHVVPIVVGLYVVLIAYQATLWNESRQSRDRSRVSARASRHFGESRPGG
jgi:hypothetical protein